MKKILIAIDPDVKKNGVAYLQKRTPFNEQMFNVEALTFFELFDMLKEKKKEFDIEVYIEAGWNNKKSNFHSKPTQSKAVGEKISKSVGRNHETGLKIVEMCEYLNLPYILITPRASKMRSSRAFFQMTGVKVSGEFKQEMIDAGLLIWGR